MASESRAVIFNLFHLMAHTYITKIPWHTKNTLFANLTKNIGIILIHSQQMGIVVLAVVILFDKLRKKRSVPLTKQSGIPCSF